jgi:hypothetical protein
MRSGRLKERGEADLMRVAHADYYLGLVHRLARLRGPDRPTPSRSWAWSCRTSARRPATWSIRTASTKPATSRGALLVYWWISGFFSEVRLWMLELLEKDSRSRQHTRAAALSSRVGRDVQRPSGEVVDGLSESERLFTESGDEDAAAMAWPRRRRTRACVPRAGCRQAEAELNEGRWRAA